MFTGIITHQGKVTKITKTNYGAKLALEIGNSPNIQKGESIAINGVCLTACDTNKNHFIFDIVRETLSKTNLGQLRTGDKSNVEFPLTIAKSFGGHFIQGHIDGVGKISKKEKVAESQLMWIKVPEELTTFMVEKGSVAVDGISLTIVNIAKDNFSVALIPYTLSHTTLGFKGKGDTVNIETDILGKYVKKFLSQGKNNKEITTKITKEFLINSGI